MASVMEVLAIMAAVGLVVISGIIQRLPALT